MPAPMTTILFLFFVLIVAGSVLLFTNWHILSQNLIQILILLVISLFCVLPSNAKYFMGLEYEDAYIFTANSRYLLFNQDFSSDPLQTHTCVLGSISDCSAEATYGGHFLALPSLGYLTHRLFGYHPYAICWINLVASLISVPILYFVCCRLTSDRTCAFVASLVYAISPAMGMFHASALAETTSSLLVLVYVSCFLTIFVQKDGSDSPRKWAVWSLLAVSFVLALLSKRENLVLLTASVFAVPAFFDERTKKSMLLWTCITTVMAVLLVRRFNILQMETAEAGDIGTVTFSLRYSLALIPVFARAFLTLRWFTIAPGLFLCGIGGLFRRSARRSGWPIVFGLVLAYFVIYSGHYRSYYFVHYGSVTPFESLRYITNFFPLFAAVAGFGAGEVIEWMRRFGGRWPSHQELVLGTIGLVWVVISLGMTWSLRNEWQQVEWQNRIAPVISTLQSVKENEDYVISDLSVVFQVFGASTIRIVDADSIGTEIPTNMLFQNLKTRTVWWLRRTQVSPADIKRYPGFYEFVRQYDGTKCTTLPGPFSLCRIFVT
jgi:hypothetical protein